MANKKVLFAHDGPIYVDNQNQYYGVHYNDELINRYLLLGDSVSFITRIYPLPENNMLAFSLISVKNFHVIGVDNFKKISVYYKLIKISSIIEKAVIDSDIIVVRLPSAIGLIVMKYAKQHNKPFLVELVSCVYDALWNYNWQGKIIAHYKYFKYKQIINNVPFVIYVTSQFLQNRYPSKGKQISCSDVELQSISQNDLFNRIQKIQSYNNIKPLVIGTVAGLDVAYKGQGDVIKAIAKLRSMGQIFSYHLVGQGDQRYLRSLINKYKLDDLVTIIGPLKHDEVFAFYEQIDIYIQPSKQEGLPRAVVEAMSKACPILGAKTGGIPELIDSQLIFQPGNVNEICSLINSMTTEVMLEQSNRNYHKSLLYQKVSLDNKRKEFYKLFLSNIQGFKTI